MLNVVFRKTTLAAMEKNMNKGKKTGYMELAIE